MRRMKHSGSLSGPRAALSVVLACLLLTTSDRISGQSSSSPFLIGDKAGEKAEVAIAADQQMDFGQVADKDGSVVLGLADAITSDPDFIHYGGSAFSAICTITGDPNTAVDVSISTSASGGLSLSDFTTSEGAIPLIGVLLDSTGEMVLNIGATLTVDASSAGIGASQTVSYTITTIYN